jgi:SecD/SecF fusion protein
MIGILTLENSHIINKPLLNNNSITMRNKSLIIALTVVVALLCLYNLSFTFVARGIQQDAIAQATSADGKVDFSKKQAYLDSVWKQPVYNLFGYEYTYQDVKENELSLGLDLQGGMHVTLEVSPADIIRAMSGNSKDPQFQQALKRAQEAQKTSQESFTQLFAQAYNELAPEGRLSRIFANSANRGRISYDSSNDEVISVIDSEVEDAIDRSFQIIRTRIDKFGATQPNIQRLPGTGRIQVEIPGADNPERIRKQLSAVARLEFLEVFDPNVFGQYLDGFNQFLIENADSPEVVAIVGTPAKATDKTAADPFASADSALAANPLTDSLNALAGQDSTAIADSLMQQQQNSLLSRLFVPMGGTLGASTADTAKINRLLALPQVRGIFPPNMRFMWDVKPSPAGNAEYVALYPVKKGRDGRPALEGDVIVDARQDIGQNGQPEVNMTMSSNGAKKWRKLTADNIGNRIAIVLDEQVYSAPNVMSEIAGGSSSISGSFTLEEAKDLATILKAGKLPAPTKIVEEALIGPSLGKEAINQGFTSIAVGLGLVVLFMIMYYGSGGIVANIALLVNIFFIIGILAQFSAALTLPGIAGIVLTIGMSVDANVLIFERIKEELNLGKPISLAISDGYSKAYSSIIDANVTTFLTGVILYYLGSGPIKGFAITLMIGIVCSFFTAVLITRLIVEWAVRTNKVPSFNTVVSNNLFNTGKLNIVESRKKAYAFSGIVIIAGLAIMLTNGLNFGVDFTGGRSYVVAFNKAIPASEVKVALTDDFQNAGTEVKTYDASNQLKITTSYLANDDSEEADKAVEAALMQGLQQYGDTNPEVLSTSKVGSTIADDIKNASQTSVIFSLIVIFLYILIRFRSWQFGLSAVVALFHDVLMVLSVIAISRLLGFVIEIDQVFIAAMLTVVGYSINNTVVIFDRIREYITDNPRLKVVALLDDAVSSTMSRTIMTSFTTLLVVLILFLFGGEILRGFSYALLIGIVLGTYSSIFIAPSLVLDTTKKDVPVNA